MWPFRRSDQPGLGQRGERIARRFLKKRWLKILATNYRCPAGEVDLIALDASTRRDQGAGTIAIVEVKTRSSDLHTDPQAAVDADKRRRMRRVADYYLATHDAEDLNVRFDIVAVLLRDGQKPEVNYIPDAF